MTETADFFRARLDELVDHSYPLVVLTKRLPWGAIEQALTPHFAREASPGLLTATQDLLRKYWSGLNTVRFRHFHG